MNWEADDSMRLSGEESTRGRSHQTVAAALRTGDLTEVGDLHEKDGPGRRCYQCSGVSYSCKSSERARADAAGQSHKVS